MMPNRITISLSLLLIFLACAKESPANLLSESKELITEQKYSEALEKLRLLVGKYPDGIEAAEGQYMIGDTYIAFNKNFELAIKEYSKVVKHYPDSRFAINAQFMIGYVFANFVQDYESARIEYERFLELFEAEADSGLVQSVKFELQNLGKDLNDIPQLKHISS
ncbi:MAG: hypothetical protein CMG71_04815 [Candidatus Marinimicrobia bacterium]|nr:hypothetical protein [Candidatus Neomarinimicrobiota bacterium]|tara:strand:+ start:13728 stop:14222 length:495 start_codon:yes stop_codon:yes gene_type:complete